MEHSDFMDRLLLEITKNKFPIKLYKRHIGKFKPLYSGRVVSIGLKGQCDLYGFLIIKNKPAQCIEIEIKANKQDKLRQEQIQWRDKCIQRNIHWYESRDIEKTIQWLGLLVTSQ